MERDYSAVLYLNDDFEGGEFVFTSPKPVAKHQWKVEAEVKPKCGRLVGFRAEDLHGVKAVISGRRCAIAMWYTLDPYYREKAHSEVKKILENLEREQQTETIEKETEKSEIESEMESKEEEKETEITETVLTHAFDEEGDESIDSENTENDEKYNEKHENMEVGENSENVEISKMDLEKDQNQEKDYIL